MKKKVLSVFLVIAILFSTGMMGCASEKTDPRDSIAVVTSWFDEVDYGLIGWARGTCFFVGEAGKNPRYMITNYHVISEFVDFGSGELGTYTYVNGEGNSVTLTGRSKIRIYFDSNDYEDAFLIAGDESKDIAVLKLAGETTKRVPLSIRVPNEDMVGSQIKAVGYPSNADNIYADSVTSLGRNDATVTSGAVSRFVTTSGTGREDIQIDCAITAGNSGGPVVDDNNNVIGIATWGVLSVNYAINIKEALPILTQNNVPYTEANSFNTTILFIALAVIVALVVVFAVVILIIKGKRKTAKPTPEPQKKPVVRSLANCNAGAAAVVRGQILLGRSSACNLQFPANTAGVSANHCSIRFDETSGDFILMDMGSSYGTYLNGRKLEPNVPVRIRPGDRFALGDSSNVVIAELV